MTHTELQTALGELLDVDTNRYPLTVRTLHINHAIRSLELDVDTQWGHATDTFDTVADQRNYSPTTDLGGGSPSLTFSHPVAMYYLGSEGAEIVIPHVTWEELRASYPLETENGPPEVYAIWNGELQLAPKPDDVYTIYLDYFGFQADLSASGDSNPWTTQAPNLVLYRACVLATEWLLEDERVPLWKERAQEEELRLVVHLSQLEQSGRRMESTEY